MLLLARPSYVVGRLVMGLTELANYVSMLQVLQETFLWHGGPK